MGRGAAARVAGAWGFAAGCLQPSASPLPVVDPDRLPAPEIAEVSLGCAREAGRWSLTVRTSSWADGGVLWWTVDGTYDEEHTGLRSVQAGADGLSDRLTLDVSIVDAVRGAGNGRTLFRCGAEVRGAVAVTDLAGEVTDCVRWGPPSASLDEYEDWPAGCDREVSVEDG